MHSIEIKSVEDAYFAVDGNVMVVTVEVFQELPDAKDPKKSEKKFLGIRKFNYALNTDEQVIMLDLQRMKKTLDSDYKVGQESAELEAGLANTTKVKKSLTGKTL